MLDLRAPAAPASPVYLYRALCGLQNAVLPHPEFFDGAIVNSDNRQSPLDANQIAIATSRGLVFSNR